MQNYEGRKSKKEETKQTFSAKSLRVSQNVLTFAPHLAKLGYGVMVTLQILVLSFMVRVHIPQQK